jgi:opacity protein-like surface antigen
MSRTARNSQRHQSWIAPAAVVVGAVLLALVPQHAEASRASRAGVPTSRKGAEIWVEAPRYALPAGDGYVGEYALEYEPPEGLGFGFGIMFGIADKVGIVGRLVQSNHKVLSTGDHWDLDQAFVFLKYAFIGDGRAQPFVGAGYVHYSLEWDPGEDETGDFTRLTGHGFGVSAGVDYFYSPRIIVSLRADYSIGGYSRRFIGTDEETLDEPLDGSTFGASITIGYRVPL